MSCAGIDCGGGSSRLEPFTKNIFEEINNPSEPCRGLGCLSDDPQSNTAIFVRSDVVEQTEENDRKDEVEKMKKREARPLRFAGPPKDDEEAERRNQLEEQMFPSSRRPVCKGTLEACNPELGKDNTIQMAADFSNTLNAQVEKREAMKMAERPACEGTFEECYPEAARWRDEVSQAGATMA